MRVLYLQPAEGFGGAERQGVVHIRRLRDLGIEVVPVVGPGEPIRRALEDVGVSDYVFMPDLLSENNRPLSRAGIFKSAAASVRTWWRMQARLRDLARERAVDLIFASRSVGWIAASPVARRLGLPLVWRGGGRPTGRGQRVSLRFLARLWRPDALVCNCEAVRRDLEPLVRAPSYIVHNGVDTARFDPQRVVPRFRRDAGIGPDVPVVGFSGRPAPEKGLEVLGAALVRVARDLPNLRVFIAGEFGWRAEYERLFGALGLAERTTFLGHVQDIESVYASCDVIALTSHNHSIEGSPNAVLEAMAMERPIVATAVGGLPELIQDGVQGFLVPAEDAAGLATHLGRLLGDPALRRQLGAAGRATIVESYDDRSVTRRLASVLQLVAARAAARHLPTPPLQLGLNAHQH